MPQFIRKHRTRRARTTQGQQRVARPGEINHDPTDRFTIGHAAVGALAALGRVPPHWAVTVAIGWELVERPLKNRFPGIFPNRTQDTLQNAVFDAAAMLAAYALVRALFPPPGR